MKVKDVTYITLAQAARELGLPRKKARKEIAKVERFVPLHNGRIDARAIDLLRALRGQEHRTLEPIQSDWLTRYLKENPDDITREGRRQGQAQPVPADG